MWTHLDTNYCSLLQNSEIWEWDVPGLAENVERVWIDECCTYLEWPVLS